MLRSRHHKAHLIQKLTASSYMPLLGVVIVLKLESCSTKMTLSILSMMWKNQQRAGSTKKADRDFQNLLKQQPDNPAANFAYGAFLGGSNQSDKALPYLERSAKAGYSDAYYALGMAHLMQNNTELALENFEKYKSHRPDDQSIEQIITAIKSGNIQLNAK